MTLDGETVYQGSTPTSLGYITLPLAAKHAGTHLRIQLTGSPVDVGEAHPLVELNGHVDQEAPTGNSEPPILSIVETEIYRPLSTMYPAAASPERSGKSLTGYADSESARSRVTCRQLENYSCIDVSCREPF